MLESMKILSPSKLMFLITGLIESKWSPPENLDNAKMHDLQMKICRADLHGAIIKVVAICDMYLLEDIATLVSFYYLKGIIKIRQLCDFSPVVCPECPDLWL